MLKIKKRQFKKTKASFKKFPLILGERAFLTSLALFFIAMILGGFIFYIYFISFEYNQLETPKDLLYFDTKSFQEIIKTWQERQQKFEMADSKQYSDPFKITQ